MQLNALFGRLLVVVVATLSASDNAVAVPLAAASDVSAVGQGSGNTTVARPGPAPRRLPLTPVDGNFGYTISIPIGKNSGTYKLWMDTLSSDSWVYSDRDPTIGAHHGVAWGTLPEAKAHHGSLWQVPYDGGAVARGVMEQDHFDIAGAKVLQSFGIAGQVEGWMGSVDIDGILGFGTSLGARQEVVFKKIPNLVQSLAQQSITPAPVIGWYFPHSGDTAAEGEVSFGGPNPAKYNPATLSPPMPNTNTDGRWSVSVTKSAVDGEAMKIAPRQALLSTTTSFIMMSARDAAVLNLKLAAERDAGTGVYSMPCNVKKRISFTIGNQDWAIDPVLTETPDARGNCVSAIQVAPAEPLLDTWIFGTSFMSNAYVIMDYAKNTVQLAQMRTE
ncbi:hypothetical protein EVG20_g9706 [Dentipellis fragilis]|uniref:Peptidase A1 domain-containing protein n=1 Tax=Dentipellis fragilis TaxID=205917 RepID=A0A4Y9Y0P5_9AGAM|nr:hypothetical protein EVG20_g9706 [Dentipellis fragilis]